MSHTVRLLATAPPRPPSSPKPPRSGVIGLPNPFKALRTTHLGVPDTVGISELTGRVEVDTQIELGAVPIEGTILANRIVPTNDGRRAIFWTESGLTVGTFENGDGYPLTRLRLFKYSPVAFGKYGQQRCLLSMPGGSIKVHSCLPIQWGLFQFSVTYLILSNQGNCELHTLIIVDADGVPASEGTPTANISCNLTRSTSVPRTETAIFTSAGDLVSTNTSGPSLRSVDLTILPKSGEIDASPRYHALCEISALMPPTGVHASASLVLDIDSIVIGYSKS